MKIVHQVCNGGAGIRPKGNYMKKYRHRPYLHVLGVLFLYLLSTSAVQAQFRATLEDIVRDPERYYGLTLRITGKALGPSEKGYYLENDIGTKIEISSKDLPVFSIKYDIVVRVNEQDNFYLPELVELERKKYTGGYNWLIISLVVSIMGVLSVGS